MCALKEPDANWLRALKPARGRTPAIRPGLVRMPKPGHGILRRLGYTRIADRMIKDKPVQI